MALKEIALRMPNRPGQIARVARLLAEQKINIAAISLDSAGARSSVRLIPDRPDRAMTILEDAGFTVDCHDTIVVQLEDRAGSFLKVLDMLAASKVNVESIAILVAREGGHTLAAIATDDFTRARRVLQEGGFASGKAEALVTNADILARAPAIPSESVGLLL
jgi:hypothetical protein